MGTKKEYISREAALKVVCTYCTEYSGDDPDFCCDCMDKFEMMNIPVADVVEVQHGHWEEVSWGDFDCCSICGCSVERQQFKYYYCPHCGNPMDEKYELARDSSECRGMYNGNE
jgi:predicted amidophosphoribosyltransferase